MMLMGADVVKRKGIRLSPAAFLLLCRSLSFSSAEALKVAVITGTTRTSGPPRPIVGPRVAAFVSGALERRGNDVTVVDPREVDFGLLEKPHFAYAKSQVPEGSMRELYDIFQEADMYVAVTPEYNHAPSPGLLNILNHYGSSTFGFKPSAIVSYSQGQWGGARAAQALRPILSELGCIPVSAMVHIPAAQDVFDEDGSVADDSETDRWNSYVDRCFSQLEWWATAAKEHRSKVDPYEQSPAFQTSPSQRNAPDKQS